MTEQGPERPASRIMIIFLVNEAKILVAIYDIRFDFSNELMFQARGLSVCRQLKNIATRNHTPPAPKSPSITDTACNGMSIVNYCGFEFRVNLLVSPQEDCQFGMVSIGESILLQS